MKRIDAPKGWGIELQWGGLAGYSQLPECKEIAASDVSGLFGAKLVRVRVIRESDYRRLLALAKKSAP